MTEAVIHVQRRRLIRRFRGVLMVFARLGLVLRCDGTNLVMDVEAVGKQFLSVERADSPILVLADSSKPG